MKRILFSLGRIAVAVLVIVGIGSPIFLYFYQERLLFYPESINEVNRKAISQRER